MRLNAFRKALEPGDEQDALRGARRKESGVRRLEVWRGQEPVLKFNGQSVNEHEVERDDDDGSVSSEQPARWPKEPLRSAPPTGSPLLDTEKKGEVLK